MERDGGGENLNFRAWWRVCGWWCGCGCAGVDAVVVMVGCSRVQGCKGTRTSKGCFYACFVVVYYWVVKVFLYLWRVVLVRAWWRPFGSVGCGGGGGGGVELVVVEVGRAIPLSSSV